MNKLLSIFLIAFSLPVLLLGRDPSVGEFSNKILYNDTVYLPYFDNGREVREVWSHENVLLLLFNDSLYEMYYHCSMPINYPVGSNPRFIDTNLTLDVDTLLYTGKYVKNGDTLELEGEVKPKKFAVAKFTPALKDSISLKVSYQDVDFSGSYYWRFDINLKKNGESELEIPSYDFFSTHSREFRFSDSSLTDHKINNFKFVVGWKYYEEPLDLEDLSRNTLRVFDLRPDSDLNQPINDVSVYLHGPYPDFAKRFLLKDNYLLDINRAGTNIPLEEVCFRNLFEDKKKYRAVFLRNPKSQGYERIHYDPSAPERISPRRCHSAGLKDNPFFSVKDFKHNLMIQAKFTQSFGVHRNSATMLEHPQIKQILQNRDNGYFDKRYLYFSKRLQIFQRSLKNSFI